MYMSIYILVYGSYLKIIEMIKLALDLHSNI
jgi:hypothetical protein